jgi:RES domain-containing protein
VYGRCWVAVKKYVGPVTKNFGNMVVQNYRLDMCEITKEAGRWRNGSEVRKMPDCASHGAIHQGSFS